MSEFRLAPEAEAELDDIWLHIARESGNADIATRIVENITSISGCWRCNSACQVTNGSVFGRLRSSFGAIRFS